MNAFNPDYDTALENDRVLNALNCIDTAAIADAILTQLGIASDAASQTGDHWDLEVQGDGVTLISHKAIPIIAAVTLDIFANMISSLINAGSERDAVNENDRVLAELTSELTGWSDHAPH